MAVSLALALAETHPVELVDCDVEEPNDHIFLSPTIRERKPVEVLVPEVEREACLGCGACAKACRFGALVGNRPAGFLPLRTVSQLRALSDDLPNPGHTGGAKNHGLDRARRGERPPFSPRCPLNVGEPRATPVIRALKEMTDPKRLTILDSPPGTGCPMVETVKGADYVILVTEPTPFGLHDLQAALAVTEALGVPAGVVVSKWGVGTDHVERFCAEKGLPMLLRIPWDQAIARAYANGIPLVEALPEWREPLRQLFHDILLARGGSGNG
jgi:MinD superfamily P-loop ATPase